MRRFITSLKYVPAVVLGLVVIAWVVSWFALVGVAFKVPVTGDEVRLEVSGSTVEVALNVYYIERFGPFGVLGREICVRNLLGFVQFRCHLGKLGRPVMETEIPLPLLATFVLPFAIAPFTRFRFPLWSCFAWTALVAAQLAYHARG
jgi:hypothetical protein